jgi:hypothetical protein
MKSGKVLKFAGCLLAFIFIVYVFIDDGKVQDDKDYKQTFGIERPHTDKELKATAPIIFKKLGEMEDTVEVDRATRNNLRHAVRMAEEFQGDAQNNALRSHLNDSIKQVTKALSDMDKVCRLAEDTPLSNGQVLGKTPPCNDDH